MPLDQDEPRQCTSSMGIPGEGGGGGKATAIYGLCRYVPL